MKSRLGFRLGTSQSSDNSIIFLIQHVVAVAGNDCGSRNDDCGPGPFAKMHPSADRIAIRVKTFCLPVWG